MSDHMDSHEEAQRAGFDSVAEIARMVNKPKRTVQNWALNNKRLWRAVLLGCERMKKESRPGSRW